MRQATTPEFHPRLVELMKSGVKFKNIVEMLNKEGFKTVTGKKIKFANLRVYVDECRRKGDTTIPRMRPGPKKRNEEVASYEPVHTTLQGPSEVFVHLPVELKDKIVLKARIQGMKYDSVIADIVTKYLIGNVEFSKLKNPNEVTMQVTFAPMLLEAFKGYCAKNNTTMSEAIKKFAEQELK